MLNKFLLTYKELSNFDRFNYLIVFLLPVFAISVRHWVSVIFVLLFLLSSGYYFYNKKNIRPLAKEEKYLIYILLFYFCVYILSSVVHGWGKPQTHILGTMLRFIGIIPMLYMFRNLHYLLPVLVMGGIIACVSNVIYIYVSSFAGVYSYLFSGPMIFLFCILIIPTVLNYKISNRIKIILIVVMLLSILTVFELGARSAFVALFMMLIVYSLVYVKGIYRLYAIVLIGLLSVGSYYGNDSVKIRVDRISHGVSVYFNENNPEQATEKFNLIHDIAARFEMWRASKYFIFENPILGFGPNEYKNEIQVLIDNNLINSVAFASHPHNAYLHELYGKGILGLIAMLLILYYPAYVFIKHYRSNPYVSMVGISVIISFSSFSLTESAAFNNNNFSSIMLIYITIAFVSLFQRNQQNNELKK